MWPSSIQCLKYGFVPFFTYVTGLHIEHGMVQTETGEWVETICRIDVRCKYYGIISGDFWDSIMFGPCKDKDERNEHTTHCVDGYCKTQFQGFSAAPDSIFHSGQSNAVVPGVVKGVQCYGEMEQDPK